MAGKGATGGTRGGDKLSYTLLSTFDDLMTETLVDKAGIAQFYPRMLAEPHEP